MRRRPPGSPLFPYTTLFRSVGAPPVRPRRARGRRVARGVARAGGRRRDPPPRPPAGLRRDAHLPVHPQPEADRKSTRLNSSHITISYAVFCLKKKNQKITTR